VSNGNLSTGTYTYLVPKNITWNSANSYWEISVDVASFSEFYVFAGNIAPLAIGLNLEGTSTQDKNILSWKVPQNLAFEHFELQLQDNNSFNTIATLTSNATTYEYTQPNQNSSTYRIIGFDKNKQATISNTVTLSKQLTQDVTVYPNPTYDNITINIATLKSATANIKLLDPLGKLVYETDAAITEGSNKQVIDMKNLAAGTYYLMVQFGELRYSTKVLKF
jgi:Secretion system C-terminal sorting domain/Bacterial pre-peptidase C-terminal domain